MKGTPQKSAATCPSYPTKRPKLMKEKQEPKDKRAFRRRKKRANVLYSSQHGLTSNTMINEVLRYYQENFKASRLHIIHIFCEHNYQGV